MPWFQFIQKIDRRVIYILMFLGVALPLIFPIGLPIVVNKATQDTYNTLNNLPAGSKIIYSFDYSGGTAAELSPGVEAMLRFSFQKKHKVYIYANWAEGSSLASSMMAGLAKELDLKYGEDYIHLGYRPSVTATLEGMRKDFQGALGGVDVNGKPLSSYPIMQGATKASDFAAVASYTTGSNGLHEWISYWYATGDVKIITGGITAVNIPGYMPIYQAGQMKGFVGGLRGAAEFEQLIKFNGKATPGMDAQSMAHLVIIAFLIVGNIGYLAEKNAKAKA